MGESQILKHSRNIGEKYFQNSAPKALKTIPTFFKWSTIWNGNFPLKDIYMQGTTATALKNEVSTFWKFYYDKDTWFIVNQSVNEFYIRFLFKVYSLQQYVLFPLDIAENSSTTLVPKWNSYWYQKGSRFPQGYQLKKIIRETRGSFWSKTHWCKQKWISEQ